MYVCMYVCLCVFVGRAVEIAGAQILASARQLTEMQTVLASERATFVTKESALLQEISSRQVRITGLEDTVYTLAQAQETSTTDLAKENGSLRATIAKLNHDRDELIHRASAERLMFGIERHDRILTHQVLVRLVLVVAPFCTCSTYNCVHIMFCCVLF